MGSALLVALALGVLLPARPAGALPLLDPSDAAEIAQQLAEVTEEHDICYGWNVEVDDQGGAGSGRDVGSSLGPGVDVRDDRCDRWVTFVAFLSYVSDWSDAEDSASWDVETNIEGSGDWVGDLRRLGVSSEGLLGERDDVVLANAVLALPALAVERGLAEQVELESDPASVPAQDRPTARPGSDFWRTHGAAVALLTAMALGGALWGLAGWSRYRAELRRRRIRKRSRAARSGDDGERAGTRGRGQAREPGVGGRRDGGRSDDVDDRDD